MQSKENIPLEARSLQEICKTLTRDQLYAISLEIQTDLKVSPRSVENWARYGARPGNYSQRRDIARIVKTYFHFNVQPAVLAETLFPNS